MINRIVDAALGNRMLVLILIAALVVRLTGASGTAAVAIAVAVTLVPTCAACWFLQPAVDRIAKGGRR